MQIFEEEKQELVNKYNKEMERSTHELTVEFEKNINLSRKYN